MECPPVSASSAQNTAFLPPAHSEFGAIAKPSLFMFGSVPGLSNRRDTTNRPDVAMAVRVSISRMLDCQPWFATCSEMNDTRRCNLFNNSYAAESGRMPPGLP